MRTFDYVIAGAGPAGCVLANRLSADAGVSVLLLEAGPRDRHPYLHIPAGYAKLKPSEFNWGYSTVPQKELNDRELWYPQGRVVGGASSINAMIYTRGARSDYDEWSRLGCNEWSYKHVIPFFKKAEANNRLADSYHGTDGPLRVSDPVGIQPITRKMVQAVQQLGVPFTADFNGERQEGVGLHQTTTYRGRRASAATCYLKPVLGRPNLTVTSNATADRIIFDGDRAVSLQSRTSGRREEVRIARELLVTSGAIGSPKLLMLSGVGRGEELSALGINPLIDLPGVGMNLQEHFNLPVVAELNGPYGFFGDDKYVQQALWALQYLHNRTGPLTSTLGEAGAFVRTTSDLTEPDVQIHLMAAPVMPHGIERISAYGVTVASNVLRPRSRGTVTLKDSKPDTPPLIDPQFLTDPYDLEHGIAGLEFARQVIRTPILSKYISREILPGENLESTDDLIRHARNWGKMDYHPVGTCKMGEDDMSVVDQKLRLHGATNVRVCDSSIMPTQISGNTNAPTIMIAERAAHFISAGI